MDKDIKVEPVNHYGLNLNNRRRKLIATAPQIDGQFVLDRAPESTEYTDIDHSCLLAHKTTGHASWHDAEKRMLWHRRLAHVGLKALEVMPTVIADAPEMTGKYHCEICIKCKIPRKLCTPNTTSDATEPLQIVHSDISGFLETAIGGGRYMLLFIDDATRHMDKYILKYQSEALENFKEWKALREKESGKQVKRFHSDRGGEYTSMKFTEYVKSEGIQQETTTPHAPQSYRVVERANRMIKEHVQ